MYSLYFKKKEGILLIEKIKRGGIMNKRLKKKRNKMVAERINHVNKYVIHFGRQNSKTKILLLFAKAILNYKYAQFKEIKKILERKSMKC